MARITWTCLAITTKRAGKLEPEQTPRNYGGPKSKTASNTATAPGRLYPAATYKGTAESYLRAQGGRERPATAPRPAMGNSLENNNPRNIRTNRAPSRIVWRRNRQGNQKRNKALNTAQQRNPLGYGLAGFSLPWQGGQGSP